MIGNNLPAAPETDDNGIIANHWHDVVLSRGNETLEAAARAGEALAAQWDLCQSGGAPPWSPWCADNLKYSKRQAETYIKLALNPDKWQEAIADGTLLSIRGAVRLIDADKPKKPKEDKPAPFRADAGSPAPVVKDSLTTESDHSGDANDMVDSDHFPDAGQMVNETNPGGTDAPVEPEAPTAAALAVDLVRFQGRISRVETAMGGGEFEGRLADNHLECVTALLHGETPTHRLVGKSTFDPLAVAFPAKLDTPAIREAWADWIKTRREARKTVTKRAAELAIGRLEKAGPTAALEALRESAANNWQGIFPENANGRRGKKLGHLQGAAYDPDGPEPTF